MLILWLPLFSSISVNKNPVNFPLICPPGLQFFCSCADTNGGMEFTLSGGGRMIISIAVNELQTGMYLYKLDVFWLKHPLVHNEMLLSDAVHIHAIQQSDVREVW
ncbi:DUF3391 domain-containing protein, partial [Erwinia sp. MYb416]|uniref:DUF3391 domain-containing protein n=1 Tax=Erwinia sp. MYb416 TaxID=3108532 RepID=UPI00403F3043